MIDRLCSTLIKYHRIYLGVFGLVALYLTSLHSYLLFHGLAEIFTIAVAASIFFVAWNARQLYDNPYLLLLGIACLFVGCISAVHTLAYKGMGVFQGYGTNLSIQLWVIDRGLLGVTFLIAPLLVGKKLRADLVMAIYTIVAIMLLDSIFIWNIFPVCYIDKQDGGSLTLFKIIAEYVIIAMLLTGLLLLLKKRAGFDPKVFKYLAATIITLAIAEIFFTLYESVYDTTNLIGHLLAIISFYFLYRAMVETALEKPYSLLFRELKQREEELRAAQKMQEQMTEFLVHDLRSPLTSVISGIETLRSWKKKEFDETDRQLLDDAMASSNWLMTLTNALLDASRLESGRMPVQPDMHQAGELVEAALEQVSLWARGIRVNLQAQIDADGISVFADRSLTVRVLVNLLSNAIKYSPTDSTVSIKVKTFGGTVSFSVNDQGPGIAKVLADKIFSEFITAESRDAGVGLGLHFCKLAVEAQGGRIWLDSEIGIGTTITFALPAEPPKA